MEKKYKIYTKTGDKGVTSLIGGERVPKYDGRIEAYGTVDELNSWIGLLRDQEIEKPVKEMLLEIQNNLFTLESQLAKGQGWEKTELPDLTNKDIEKLENEIDEMEKSLPQLSSFILPGGHPVVSYCHLARTVCRRAERLTIKTAENFRVDLLNIKYLNRLSDFLFVLSRKLSNDLNAEEIHWNH